MLDFQFALRVSNLSKIYRIGLRETQHDSLGDALLDFLKSPLNNFRKYRSLYKFDDLKTLESGEQDEPADVIWALKDVNFEVRAGEVLGIIGNNGAGKTTLLKVLSRITDPTRGEALISGRVSSLLEVGTGFHPELTGRENVYLNGTILGMKKREVDRKFDEIVEFSGVEKFLDTPVKRYSTGMKVRLAFSVAAHLEPEVLVIDEVLAVGDADFQKKCLSKMEDVGQSGRTVLFVSHNLPAVTRLCTRAILLDGGRLVMDGPAHEVVGKYMTSGSGTIASRFWQDPKTAPGGEVARLRMVKICDWEGQVNSAIDVRKPFHVWMEYEVLKSGFVLHPHFYFWNQEGICVFGTSDMDPEWRGRPRPQGRYLSRVEIPGDFLREGLMYVNAALITLNPKSLQFWEKSVVAFQILDFAKGDSARGDYTGNIGGVVRPLLEWETSFTTSL